MPTASIRTVFFGMVLNVTMAISGPAKAGPDCLRMVSVHKGVDNLILPSLQAKLKEHGLCIDVSNAPSSRATVLLRRGEIDGEVFRVREYRQEVGDAASLIPVAIFEGYGLVLAKSPNLLSFDNLKDKPIAMIRGTFWQYRVFPPSSQRVEVEDYRSAVTMLETGRVSALLIDNLSRHSLSELTKGYVSRPVTPKTSAFFYLHKRHKDLIPAFVQAIRDWKSGFYAKLDGI